jgi:hypothetical protein
VERATVAFSGLVCAIAVASIPLAATAVPGQTLAQFTAWKAQQPLLRGMTRTTDEMSGRPDFSLLTADHGIAWSMNVKTDGATVTSETLAVSTPGGEPGSEPIHPSGAGYGFSFFRSLYGAALADDLRNAKPAASFIDPTNKSTTTFVRGQRFGYTIASGYITVSTFAAFDAAVALMRRCAARPESCSE